MRDLDHLEEKEDDKPNGQPEAKNGLRANQEKDGEKRNQTYNEDREWRHWGDR